MESERYESFNKFYNEVIEAATLVKFAKRIAKSVQMMQTCSCKAKGTCPRCKMDELLKAIEKQEADV